MSVLSRRAALAGGVAGGLALAGGAARAQPAGTTPPRPSLPAARTTPHVVELPGRTLRFSATAGAVTLGDGGTPQAAVAYVAYRLDGADPASRPVTFAFNGGPGSASAWLHLGALGPWRIGMDGAARAPSATPALLGNAETWLDFTDLVFIDPVGTGYSRLLAGGEEVRRRVWSVGGDIDSLAETIRHWLEQAGRMGSPKFLAGESYGGFRGPRLVRALAQSHGVGIRGLVLLSPALDFGGRSNAMDALHWAAALPSLTAVARRAESRAAVADAEAYAAGDYLADLVRGNADPAATARRVARVAALTGLDPALVARMGGRVDGGVYARHGQEGRLASLYDLSVTLPDPVPTALYPAQIDPMGDALRAPLTAAMLELYGQRLGWQVEAPYELSNMAVNRAWDFGTARNPPESVSHLRTALALDPALRVLVAHGLYDVVTPYFRTKMLLDTIEPSAGAERVSLQVWPGGHMFFSQDGSRAAFRAEGERLYK